MRVHLSRWFSLRKLNRLFGIFAQVVGSIFRMYKVVLLVGKLSQPYRRLATQSLASI
jgi:hypothetical protein